MLAVRAGGRVRAPAPEGMLRCALSRPRARPHSCLLEGKGGTRDISTPVHLRALPPLFRAPHLDACVPPPQRSKVRDFAIARMLGSRSGDAPEDGAAGGAAPGAAAAAAAAPAKAAGGDKAKAAPAKT